ncbi:carbonic anhydrase [Fictibacillus nanhaiensis]|uniref:beta-class carbonic anhydrase n=1 Tax=Fictibacillus nanhaiensis TaxID=742169 RepID=UPI002E2055A3|nr:carbonic anhydrase [Fictibacillus nanhaiensis]
MSVLNEILAFNHQFVENKEYEPFQTTKFPDKGLVIVSCMDTRLTELLPSAMNIKNGDVKVIKSAGAVISHPFGSIMRSILVAIYELKAEEVMVIGHYDCGMSNVNADGLLAKMKDRGIEESTFDTLKYSGLDLKKWVQGFESVEDSVRNSVQLVKNHPLLPADIKVHGLVIDPATGRLDLVERGE